MDIKNLEIAEVKLFTPRKFSDARGFFVESFRSDTFKKAVNDDIEFVQDNHSFSAPIYTVRGLHFQTPPHAQGKLVRCTRGRILDVAVDARKGSPTYGKYVKAELSADNGVQIYVPAGFLHGFATLEENCEVQYKCTDYYAPECDGNVVWNDPTLNIDWGFDAALAILSDKDRNAPSFSDFESPF